MVGRSLIALHLLLEAGFALYGGYLQSKSHLSERGNKRDDCDTHSAAVALIVGASHTGIIREKVEAVIRVLWKNPQI